MNPNGDDKAVFRQMHTQNNHRFLWRKHT